MKLQLFIIFCALKSISGGIGPVGRVASRIHGGENALDGQAPYVCSMQWYNLHYCGCVIISDQWILSISACVIGPMHEVLIVVGTNDLNSGGVHYKPREAIAHEDTDNPSLAFHIGLVRVDKIEFNEKIQPIKITTNYVEADTQVQAFGWGQLANGKDPRFLQTINLTVISNEICQEKLGKNVHDSHLCTFTKVGEGLCHGDGGSALVLGDELVGLGSWGKPCARGAPDVFSRISYLYDWVQSKINP